MSPQPVRTASVQKEASDSQAKAEPNVPSSSAQNDKALLEPVQKVKSKAKTSVPGTATQQRQKSRPKAALSLDVPAGKDANAQPKQEQKASAMAPTSQLPAKLDISAARDASKENSNSETTSFVQEKPKEISSSVAPVEPRPVTPATPTAVVSHAAGASVPRSTQSRTIRVLATPVAEAPPPLPSASPLNASLPPPAASKKQPSRRGSFASIQLPGTPISERISDNASLTSASISRANTPPPTKVGSAPVRQISKSQQKKERQARAKTVEGPSKTQEAPVAVEVAKPEQAPIVGRKKKAKKTAASGTTDSTPTVTRPSSPTPKEEGSQASVPVPSSSNKPLPNDIPKAQTPTSPDISSNGDQQSKNSLTAAAILAKLHKSGDISPTILNIFKSVAGANYRFELGQADFAESETGPILSAAQARQINDGDAITFDYPPNKRIIILPDRRLLRGLSAEQAERYLELRKRILSTPDATAFHPPRHSIDRYLHATPHRGRSVKLKNAAGNEESMGLENRFVSPPLTQATTSTMPAYWSASPLSDDGIVRRSSILSVEEAEHEMLASRKETEAIEKKLNALLKRNRKLVFGNAH